MARSAGSITVGPPIIFPNPDPKTDPAAAAAIKELIKMSYGAPFDRRAVLAIADTIRKFVPQLDATTSFDIGNHGPPDLHIKQLMSRFTGTPVMFSAQLYNFVTVGPAGLLAIGECSDSISTQKSCLITFSPIYTS